MKLHRSSLQLKMTILPRLLIYKWLIICRAIRYTFKKWLICCRMIIKKQMSSYPSVKIPPQKHKLHLLTLRKTSNRNNFFLRQDQRQGHSHRSQNDSYLGNHLRRIFIPNGNKKERNTGSGLKRLLNSTKLRLKLKQTEQQHQNSKKKLCRLKKTGMIYKISEINTYSNAKLNLTTITVEQRLIENIQKDMNIR